jgi:hypothetical protein
MGTAHILPASAARGEWDHAKHGGGVVGSACANYPSTAVPAVPLPICDGEDFK